MYRPGNTPRNPRFGRSKQKFDGGSGKAFRPGNFYDSRSGGMNASRRDGGIEHDYEGGPDFPGKKLPKEQWTRTRAGLGDRGKKFDWAVIFGREAVRVVDLGCGNGRYIISSALRRPEADHLGVELVPPAVRLGSLRAGQRGLTNCKLAWGDATEFILERCEPESLDEVHLYHPQPYYETDKTGRRQLSPEVLLAIFTNLKPGGLFIFQTDNPAYFEYAKKTVPQLFDWRELPGPWPDAPEGRTLREIVARGKGLTIFRAEARKLQLTADDAAARIAAMPAPDFDANKPGHGTR